MHYILFRINMDSSKLQMWSGSQNNLLTTLCHVTLQHETLNVWIEPSSIWTNFYKTKFQISVFEYRNWR